MRQSFSLAALLFLGFFEQALATAPDIPVTLHVQRQDGGTIRRAYVALVPLWRPSNRPLVETVADKGVAILRVPAGTYQVLAGAQGFAVALKDPIAISSSGVPNLIVQLHPLKEVSGTVNDSDGNPIASARVATMNAVTPAPFGSLSELAASLLAADWSTKTDAHGQWMLNVPEGDVPLLFGAPGRTTEWRVVAKEGPPSLDVVLAKGAALDITADRMDPNLIVTLALEEGATTTVPAEEQPRIWTRRANSRTLAWDGLPAGRYGVYAKYPGPNYFMQAAMRIGAVTLTAAATQSLRVALPPARRPTTTAARLFLRRATREGLGDTVQAFERSATGQWRPADAFVEEVVGGSVVYLKTDHLNGPFYGRSVKRFLYAPEVPGANEDTNTEPLPASLYPRADARLRLRFAEKDFTPPRSGTAVLNGCGRNRIPLPVEISKDSMARFTAPAGCQSLVLDFEPFERVVTDKVLQPGDQFLGEFTLRAAALADVHVVRNPAGTPVAGAAVRAFNQKLIIVDETHTDDHGWGHLSGLPSYARLRVIAETTSGDKSDAATLQLAPRERGVVDPLSVPDSATLLIDVKIEEGFLARFPDARIVSIFIRPDDSNRLSEQQQQDALRTPPPLRFERLHPGRWALTGVVNVAGTYAPIDMETVELKPGETRRVEAKLAPNVFEGMVTSDGAGVAAKLTIDLGDGRLNFISDATGRFHAVLPHRGTYRVVVARLQTQGNLVPVGDVPFLDPAQPVEITIPPSGGVSARVRAGERPVSGALVWLAHRDPAGSIDDMTQRARTTNASGQATFDDLSAGPWTLSVRDEEGHRGAQKTVVVHPGEQTAVDLELARAMALEGTIKDLGGSPLPHALIDCLFDGPTGLPERAVAESDPDGKFVIDLIPPAPPDALCSVVSYTGAVDAFKASPGQPVEITLTGATGSLRILDWTDPKDELWLVAGDGRVISLNSVAAAIGRSPSALTIPGLAAGRWNLVRAGSMSQWLVLAGGLGDSLPSLETVDLRAGSAETIHLRGNRPQSGVP